VARAARDEEDCQQGHVHEQSTGRSTGRRTFNSGTFYPTHVSTVALWFVFTWVSVLAAVLLGLGGGVLVFGLGL
jgi:hypothetical protein